MKNERFKTLFPDNYMQALVLIHIRQHCELDMPLDFSFSILHNNMLFYKYMHRCHAD
jgi:hypothetical protein